MRRPCNTRAPIAPLGRFAGPEGRENWRATGGIAFALESGMPDQGRASVRSRGAFISGPVLTRDVALLTDLYELTMAASYFREAMAAAATFSLFVRKLPPTRGF